MLRRVESDDRPQHAHPHGLQPLTPENAVPAIGESDFESSLLPRDHPKWNKDALTLSARARDLISRLRPVVVKVLTFWDHRIRSAIVGGNRIGVDASGSYRLE